MKDSILSYSVGPLLYCPANRADLALSVQQEKFGRQYSLALCLEDTINDRFLAQAEEMFLCTLTRIYTASQTRSFFIPKIFVRVRHVSQIKDLLCRLKETSALLTGFILPKFDLSNADDYIRSAAEINQNSDKPYYVMPILESPAIIDIHRRAEILYEIRDKLQAIEDIVLNIRVGGNDLCHAFGFRRDEHTSIHKILPIAALFSDIITVFGRDYAHPGAVRRQAVRLYRQDCDPSQTDSTRQSGVRRTPRGLKRCKIHFKLGSGQSLTGCGKPGQTAHE